MISTMSEQIHVKYKYMSLKRLPTFCALCFVFFALFLYLVKMDNGINIE